jgi:hypothetical protein
MSIEDFNEMLLNYTGFKIYELDEMFLRERGDRYSYLNPN